MARNTEQQTIPKPNHKDTPDYQAIFASYTEMIEQTTESLSTYLVNMDHLLNTSDTGAYRLLRLISDRYEFIVNDMKRELKGKYPLVDVNLECLDLSEEFKQKHLHHFQAEGRK